MTGIEVFLLPPMASHRKPSTPTALSWSVVCGTKRSRPCKPGGGSASPPESEAYFYCRKQEGSDEVWECFAPTPYTVPEALPPRVKREVGPQMFLWAASLLRAAYDPRMLEGSAEGPNLPPAVARTWTVSSVFLRSHGVLTRAHPTSTLGWEDPSR
ncbi:hypothetical protein J6590_083263 [Homalodisca vitripennis]|nr:hypothetical protein J6590_083263 [Homalodisca vitripennis]